jgi:endoglucanase
MMKRRSFLKAALASAAALSVRPSLAAEPAPTVSLAKKLPRWRGFNLMEMNKVMKSGPFRESDFAWIRQWGFDFVRLPLDYRCWTDPVDPYKADEEVLCQIDQAIEFGRKYDIHVNLCLHRAPGYICFPPWEKRDLW